MPDEGIAISRAHPAQANAAATANTKERIRIKWAPPLRFRCVQYTTMRRVTQERK